MNDPVTMRETLKQIVVAFIVAEPDPQEQKARVIIARQDGHLTDQEDADWINILDLRAA